MYRPREHDLHAEEYMRRTFETAERVLAVCLLVAHLRSVVSYASAYNYGRWIEGGETT